MLLSNLQVRLSEDGKTIIATGDIDLSAKAAFVQGIGEVLTVPRMADVPHLDLTGIGFMDSAGMEALLWANRQLLSTGDKLHVLIKDGSQPARVLRLSGFPRAFRIDFL